MNTLIKNLKKLSKTMEQKRRLRKFNIFNASLFVVSAFFAISLLLSFLSSVSGSASRNIFCLFGNFLFGAYGYSSIFIPVFFLIAALQMIGGKWTFKRGVILAGSLLPFFTLVGIEKICNLFAEGESGVVTGFKIVSAIIFGLAIFVGDFFLLSFLGDYLQERFSRKFNFDDLNESDFDKKETEKSKTILLNKEQEVIEKSEKNNENVEEKFNESQEFDPSKISEGDTVLDFVKNQIKPVDLNEILFKSAEREVRNNVVVEKSENSKEENFTEEETKDYFQNENPIGEEDSIGTNEKNTINNIEDLNSKSQIQKYEDVMRKILPDFIYEDIKKDEPKIEEKTQAKENQIASTDFIHADDIFSSMDNDAAQNPVLKNSQLENFSESEPSLEIFESESETETETESEVEEESADSLGFSIDDAWNSPQQASNVEEEIERIPESEVPQFSQLLEDDEDESFENDDFDDEIAAYENRFRTLPKDVEAEIQEEKVSSKSFEDEKVENQNKNDFETPRHDFYDERFENASEKARIRFENRLRNYDFQDVGSVQNEKSEIENQPNEILDSSKAFRVENDSELQDAPIFESEVQKEEEVFEIANETDYLTENQQIAKINISENSQIQQAKNENFESEIENEIETEVDFENLDEKIPEILDSDSKNQISPQIDVYKSSTNKVHEQKTFRKGPYIIPTDLLKAYSKNEYMEIDEETKVAGEKLKDELSIFQIETEVTGIIKGPTVTMYELLPAPGVKLSKITALQDNIALRLAASSVRIVAPIPGKQVVGIEVPNKNRATIGFRELIEEDAPAFEKMAIPVVLGKDISGETKFMDLAKTPHLLIAGSTGSGKSVCVNTMLLSILYKRSPSQVKLVLVDPKVVELKLYNDIPHLLTPVITEPKKALQALQYCVCEMERRYAMLSNINVRDIISYNKRISEQNLVMEKLPYIVVIIDEFADLMATTGKELETTIARLAAKSRAVGIHLVLATQRPSVDVITGLIKSNIPSRIAFMVASKMDSRIIIDQVGAEKLLGKGDMLHVGVTEPFPTRIQGTFAGDEEVERVVEYVKTFGEPNYIDDEMFVDEEEEDDNPSMFGEDEDPLYDQALEIVVQSGKTSASYIQRRLKIGYNRAARLIEEMEARGILGPANGSKPREIIHMP